MSRKTTNVNLVGKRVAVYARTSADCQHHLSIEDQLQRCIEDVRRLGGEVDAKLVFRDDETSGSALERPGLEQLMRVATSRPRHVDVVYAENVNRIARVPRHWTRIYTLLSFAKVRFVFGNEVQEAGGAQ